MYFSYCDAIGGSLLQVGSNQNITKARLVSKPAVSFTPAGKNGKIGAWGSVCPESRPSGTGRGGAGVLDKKVLDWLLEGPAWMRYAVELQLLDKRPDPVPALSDSSIRRIIERLKGRDVGIPALKTGRVHYTEAGKAYWDLFFLADIGLNIAEAGLENEVEEIFRFQGSDGSFVIPPNVQDNYFCMSAILLSSLARMGYRDDPRLAKYIRAVMGSQCYDGGWHCYDDGSGTVPIESCPMDNLNILMLLGQYGSYRDSPALRDAIDLLLGHWNDRQHRHGFGVGSRFRCLEYPAVKYGILRVLDVLSLFPYAMENPAFHDMLDFVRGKADNDGRYAGEAATGAYSGFDFDRAFEPSRWITFLVTRVEKRRAGS
jgi:hypothetical protein